MERLNLPFWHNLDYNDDETDRFFCIIGKSFLVCTRFEKYCKNLHLITEVRREVKNDNFELNEENLNKFANKVYNKTLFKNIQYLENLSVKDFYKKLVEAKNIRNEIAHDITLGFDYLEFPYQKSEKTIEYLKPKIKEVLETEFILISIISRITNDHHPTPSYIDINLKWVFDN